MTETSNFSMVESTKKELKEVEELTEKLSGLLTLLPKKITTRDIEFDLNQIEREDRWENFTDEEKIDGKILLMRRR